MATHRCGWCGTPTHMSNYGSGKVLVLQNGYRVESAFSCDQCGRLSIGTGSYSRQPAGGDTSSMRTFWADADPQDWSPRYIEGQEPHDVPEHIARAAGEAHKGASISNYMSAILMARTVIEATAKDKGIIAGTLAKKIEAMLEANLIRPHVKEAADEVRHFGNDMAHGDITIPVDEDDAVEVLALMDEILNEVYQGPARTAALRERRLARRDAS